MDSTPDRITKQIVLRAPLQRVWHAISDSRQFGRWFGVDFAGPFVAGQPLQGRIRPTEVDPEVAKSQEPFKGVAFEIQIEAITPMQRFAFRWHPFAVDKSVDLRAEPMTLVEFLLEEAAGGTRLTIHESGFAQLPEARRAVAFGRNEGGWSAQVKLVEKFLAQGEPAGS